MKKIPNLFTLLNLIFGCCAIVMTRQLWMSSLFIGLAALVDFLDGWVARLFKASSELGRQLDSLADVVSFGVAPSLIIFQFLSASYAQEPGGIGTSWLLLTPAFLFACAAAYRLGKFNIDETQRYHFKGIPTPVAGLVVASLPLIYWFSSNDAIQSVLLNKWFWYGLTAGMAWLMVSQLPMMALKFRKGEKAGFIPLIILVLIALPAAIFLNWLAVPLLFIAYITVSLLFQKKFT